MHSGTLSRWGWPVAPRRILRKVQRYVIPLERPSSAASPITSLSGQKWTSREPDAILEVRGGGKICPPPSAFLRRSSGTVGKGALRDQSFFDIHVKALRREEEQDSTNGGTSLPKGHQPISPHLRLAGLAKARS